MELRPSNGGIYPSFTNCIVWGNTAPTGPQFNNSVSSPVITYCCVQGGVAGTGNISIDPLFVSTSDLHLQAGSPCIETGNSAAVPVGVALDLSTSVRIMGFAVDMGAYEFIPSIRFDFDHDGDVDGSDLIVFRGCAARAGMVHANTVQCNASDADSDSDVDANDFGAFQHCYSGASMPARASCAG